MGDIENRSFYKYVLVGKTFDCMQRNQFKINQLEINIADLDRGDFKATTHIDCAPMNPAYNHTDTCILNGSQYSHVVMAGVAICG